MLTVHIILEELNAGPLFSTDLTEQQAYTLVISMNVSIPVTLIERNWEKGDLIAPCLYIRQPFPRFCKPMS